MWCNTNKEQIKNINFIRDTEQLKLIVEYKDYQTHVIPRTFRVKII